MIVSIPTTKPPIKPINTNPVIWKLYVRYPVESKISKLIAILFTVPSTVITLSVEFGISEKVFEDKAGLADLNKR